MTGKCVEAENARFLSSNEAMRQGKSMPSFQVDSLYNSETLKQQFLHKTQITINREEEK